MKISAIFPLLLLVCSVFTSVESTEVQQPCSQDIHAVLREMTASLAQLKVEMKFLQKLNQEHAAKLKQLEAQKTEVDRQKTEVDRQKTEIDRQKTEVDRQKTEVDRQKTEIDELKKQLQVKQVAFSASLLDAGAGETGPFPIVKTLIFKHVITNIGNAYNKHTGIFTAPVRGAYHFEWHIGTHGGAQVTAAVLVKNSEYTFLAWEHQSNLYGTTSNGATLLLEVGDVVFVRLWPGARVFDSASHHTTFSGHLLFTM